jgi:hypothetical protein
MRLDAERRASCPESALREFAATSLGAQRCSGSYLSALRVVLGNMALADRLGVRLTLSLDVFFASKQTMRTIISQLHASKFVTRNGWTDSLGHAHVRYLYQGRADSRRERVDLYSRIQREQEEADFRRFMESLGVQQEDCPY